MKTKTKKQKKLSEGYSTLLENFTKEEIKEIESLSLKELFAQNKKTYREWKEFVENKLAKEMKKKVKGNGGKKKTKEENGRDGCVRSNPAADLPAFRTFSLDDPPDPSSVNLLLHSLRSRLAKDRYEESREAWRVEAISSMYITLINAFAELNNRIVKGSIKTEALIKAADVISLRISTLEPQRWERVRDSLGRKSQGGMIDVTPTELAEFDAVMGRDRPDDGRPNAAHPKGNAKTKRKKNG